MNISQMESYFRGMTRAGMGWNTKISPRLTDVKVHIMSSRYTVPEIYFADSLDEDVKIVLSARILQIYGIVFSDAIKALKNTFAGDARELAQNILMGKAFWDRFQKGCDALCKAYNIEMEISFDNTELSEEVLDKIKAETEEYQRQFIHSELARICPRCQKHFIPSGTQAYKQIYCSESRRKGKGSKTERGCKEYAKDRRNYLKRKSTLTEGEKEELQRLSAKPELHTKFQWEAKIRQVLRRLGFPDNHGWVPVDKAKEVEILEEQLKKNYDSTPSK